MRFRKKPVLIEAEQFIGSGPVKGMCLDRECVNAPHVHTIHDGHFTPIQPGDWIIPEPDGRHYYPCKPDIFEATYEPA